MPEGHVKEDFTLAGIVFTFPRFFDKESSRGYLPFLGNSENGQSKLDTEP